MNVHIMEPEKLERADIRERKRLAFYRRKWFLLVVVVVIFIVFVGPWPSDNRHYANSRYARATMERLENITSTWSQGPFVAGVGVVDITPPLGEPMAGYSARCPMESDGIADRIFAKALTLSNGQKTVTILTADILLIPPEIRQAVLLRLALPPEDVYFTATHNHAGPGGFTPQRSYQIIFGDYQQCIFERMAEALARAVRESRRSMEPVSVFTSRGRLGNDAGAFICNRLDKTSPGYDSFFVTMCYRAGTEKLLAVLVNASAHPTCLSRSYHKISADYPGVVQRQIEKQYDCVCLFAAGAVGSMAPSKLWNRGQEQRDRVGQCLASHVKDTIETAKRDQRTEISPQILVTGLVEVDLPTPQFVLGTPSLSLSPLLLRLLHKRRTFVHILKIDKAVFLGMPCDYSGELASVLETRCRDVFPIITSFNGDYIGYLTPHARYTKASYETRDMNFFGPWAGEYFNDLATRATQKLQESLR